MKIRNKITGVEFGLDPKRLRVRRAQKRVKTWADTLEPYLSKLGQGYRLVMVTLTYKDVDGWRPNHIRDFMLTVRENLGDYLLAYAWVAEMQKRGAVHYHVLLLVKKGANIQMPDKAGWWVYGLSKIETAKTIYYVLSYTGKEYQKGGYPKGLRVFSVWIANGVINDVSRWFFRLSAIPAWLVDSLRGCNVVGAKFERLEGGGWCVAGKIYKSPWVVEFE